jgi:hypothetical protein
MESNAGGMVRRLALKTRFSEMGWGSTPLLSAKQCISSVMAAHRPPKSVGQGSSPWGYANFRIVTANKKLTLDV